MAAREQRRSPDPGPCGQVLVRGVVDPLYRGRQRPPGALRPSLSLTGDSAKSIAEETRINSTIENGGDRGATP
jgi:hypothetical protein